MVSPLEDLLSSFWCKATASGPSTLVATEAPRSLGRGVESKSMP